MFLQLHDMLKREAEVQLKNKHKDEGFFPSEIKVFFG